MDDPIDRLAEPAKPSEIISKGVFPFSAILSPLLLSKKTKWLGDQATDATHRSVLRWMSLCTEFLSTGRTLLFNLILALLVFAFLFMLIGEIKRPAVTLKPVAVPEKLSKSGYTPDVVAARVSAELQRIATEAQTRKPYQNIIADQNQIEFQLPGQFVSFRTFVRFIRALVGIENTEISIDVVEDQSIYLAQIRVAGGAYNGSSMTVTAPNSGQMDAFIRAIGRTAMRAVEPYILANYEISHEEVKCRLMPKCEFKESLAILEDLMKRPSRDFKWALLGRAYISYTQKRFQETLDFAHKALDVDPKFALAHTTLGNALLDLSRPDEAIQAFKRAVELDPKYSHSYNNWGNALLNLKRPDEAIEKYKKAIEANPTDHLPYINWGNALLNLKRPDEAIEKLKKAIELNPTHPLPYNNWGNALIDLQRPDEAIDKYRKALELNPTDPLPYNNWGVALLNLDRPDEAIDKYKKAIELSPTYALAYDNWALALSRMGRERESAEKYKIARDLEYRN
jgi:tetratricopeptide (TPR) repeat protein